MKAAVYNRYWPTGGGGEAFGAGVAHVLRQRGEVELLCHDPVDLEWLAERLRVDLDGVTTRVIADAPGSVTRAARPCDVFVNVSYMSNDLAPHRRSLYVVHFPTPPELGLSRPRKAVVRGLRAVSNPPAAIELVSGFYDRGPGMRGERWTTGEGVLRVTLPPSGAPIGVTILFGNSRPRPTEVSVLVDGHEADTCSIGGRDGLGRFRQRAKVHLEAPAGGDHEITIRSDVFVPSEQGGTDHRQLGVPVRGIRVGNSPLSMAETWLPWVGTRAEPAAWPSSYGALVSNSAFTASWVKRWWSTDSEVLYPPVSMQARGPKEPMILSVGRFFAAQQGHSKKQLEMVRAFKRLFDRGLRDWSLHLVGGCEPVGRSYLEQVRKEALGYPVTLHVDASGEELRDLYARASLYWHAAGLKESASRRPGSLEHFGMTTVEAMSAGAVPVVIGLAGQTETVRHGIDGFHFRSVGQLADLTQVLIDDERLRAQMSRSAEARAREFSLEAFAGRFWRLVDDLPDGTGER